MEKYDLKTAVPTHGQSGCNDEEVHHAGSIYRWLNPELITRIQLQWYLAVVVDFDD